LHALYLNVKGLVQNSKLSKHIADASWRRFIQLLEYKAKLYGRVLIKVDTFYPSSKLCSRCGFKKEDLKLCDREWECPRCGTKHDRDYNATLNLLKEGLARLKRVVGVDCPELMPVEGTGVPCEAGSPSGESEVVNMFRDEEFSWFTLPEEGKIEKMPHEFAQKQLRFLLDDLGEKFAIFYPRGSKKTVVIEPKEDRRTRSAPRL